MNYDAHLLAYVARRAADAPLPPGTSTSAHKASACVLSEFGALFDGLADAYDGKLRAKTHDAAHALLGTIQAEIINSQRAGAGRASARSARARARSTRRWPSARGPSARTGCARWLMDKEVRDREIRILGHAEPFLLHMLPAATMLGYPSSPVSEVARSLYAPGGLPPLGSTVTGMPSFAPGGPMPAGFLADGGMPMDAAGLDYASALVYMS
jgi:hypothetical protein